VYQGFPRLLSGLSKPFQVIFRKKRLFIFMSHIPKPVLVELRLRFGCSSSHRERLLVCCSKLQSSAAFKSEVTLSILAISSNCKSVSIRVHPWLNSFFPAQAVANSNLKSTVDLDLEELIWGENGLPAPLLPDLRHCFCPMVTKELWDTGQYRPKKYPRSPGP
jgi:hypothetical protein